jgi:chromosome segregation ATPase
VAFRAEAERLLLQHKATALDGERQQLSADVHTLQQQLAAAHAAFLTTQQHNKQLSADNAKLQLQVEAAVREYRANDIICCGLRDTISRLQRQLADTQETCRQQVRAVHTLSRS